MQKKCCLPEVDTNHKTEWHKALKTTRKLHQEKVDTCYKCTHVLVHSVFYMPCTNNTHEAH